jgi:hypothetical protein
MIIRGSNYSRILREYHLSHSQYRNVHRHQAVGSPRPSKNQIFGSNNASGIINTTKQQEASQAREDNHLAVPVQETQQQNNKNGGSAAPSVIIIDQETNR